MINRQVGSHQCQVTSFSPGLDSTLGIFIAFGTYCSWDQVNNFRDVPKRAIGPEWCKNPHTETPRGCSCPAAGLYQNMLIACHLKVGQELCLPPSIWERDPDFSNSIYKSHKKQTRRKNCWHEIELVDLANAWKSLSLKYIWCSCQGLEGLTPVHTLYAIVKWNG